MIFSSGVAGYNPDLEPQFLGLCLGQLATDMFARMIWRIVSKSSSAVHSFGADLAGSTP